MHWSKPSSSAKPHGKQPPQGGCREIQGISLKLLKTRYTIAFFAGYADADHEEKEDQKFFFKHQEIGATIQGFADRSES
ncbi:hypothetical protein, partial [Comamonas sp. UBA7840]